MFFMDGFDSFAEFRRDALLRTAGAELQHAGQGRLAVGGPISETGRWRLDNWTILVFVNTS